MQLHIIQYGNTGNTHPCQKRDTIYCVFIYIAELELRWEF